MDPNRAADTRAAELLGWRLTDRRPHNASDWSNYPDVWYETPSGDLENVTNVPAFGTDRNAAALLMEAVPIEKWVPFVRALCATVGAKPHNLQYYCDEIMALLRATPAQIRDACIAAMEA